LGATVGKCVEADSGGYFLHTGKKKLQYSSFESAPSSLPRSVVGTALSLLSFAIFVLLDFLVRPWILLLHFAAVHFVVVKTLESE
jgi:hypothetical protein